MTTTALMGIENEFKVTDRLKQFVSGQEIYGKLLSRIEIPYFKLGSYTVRLATGGSFYLDANEPEITTAPYPVEKEAVTAVATNLIMNRNLLAEAMQKINTADRSWKIKYQLNGYSAHYSFTLPEFSTPKEREQNTPHYERRKDLCFLLARTVNPALQLLLENRKSGGIMFRYREDGRIEICAEFVPSLEDMISGIGFQAVVLTAIDQWFAEGATLKDIEEKMRYLLPASDVRDAGSRQGYVLKTPEVIKQGRKASVEVKDAQGQEKTQRTITTQELLEHYGVLFEKAMDNILSAEEKRIVMDAVQGKRKLPIDYRGYPQGYFNVQPVQVDPAKAQSPLMKAFGNAVAERTVQGATTAIVLRPRRITWQEVEYQAEKPAPRSPLGLASLRISLPELVAFEKILAEHPEAIVRLASQELGDEDKNLFKEAGIQDLERFCSRYSFSSRHSFYQPRAESDRLPEQPPPLLEERAREVGIRDHYSRQYYDVPQNIRIPEINFERTPLFSDNSLPETLPEANNGEAHSSIRIDELSRQSENILEPIKYISSLIGIRSEDHEKLLYITYPGPIKKNIIHPDLNGLNSSKIRKEGIPYPSQRELQNILEMYLQLAGKKGPSP